MARVGSSSSDGYGGSQVDGNSSTPIRYRQGTLDYSPPLLWHCHMKSARWNSWSDENLARRYHICYCRREYGCDFWSWIDPPPTTF
ncbi:hypothetical protein BS78_03G164700 [Paspalum vaginatum]|nr:hypothetical protein BS78_03G164700 [Paspalum vaginatum]